MTLAASWSHALLSRVGDAAYHTGPHRGYTQEQRDQGQVLVAGFEVPSGGHDPWFPQEGMTDLLG